MAVNQRVGPFDTTAPQFKNDDDSFTLDHINLLSDGNNIVDVAQAAGGPVGFLNHLTATVITGSKKFGFLFPIENRKCARLSNTTPTVSLSFYAKTDTLDIRNVRAHVLYWDGTADSITSDCIGAWGAEGSNPTFSPVGPGWTAKNTAANLLLTNSWTRYKVENIGITNPGTPFTNLALFIHVDDLDLVATDVLYLTGVMLNEGSLAGDYQHQPFDQELVECQRYFRKSLNYTTEPAQNLNSAVGALTYKHMQLAAEAVAPGGQQVVFAYPMFRAPTVTYYSTHAATTEWYNVVRTAASGASSTVNVGTSGFFAANATHTDDTAGDTCQVQYTADGEM
jgi:hypothetical protein